MLHGDAKEVTIRDNGVLRLQGRFCVPIVDDLREAILEKAHSSLYSIHPGATKIYRDLRQHYWWRWMKKDIVEQKSYADEKVCDLSFMVGENVLLKVSPMKVIMGFEKRGKLSPRFIDPFEVLERVGEVSYRLALLCSLSGVHPVFHVSMLRSYHADRFYVLDYNTVQLDEGLGYEEELVSILDRQVCKLRSKKISVVKVQWRGQPFKEVTWETEKDMQSKYPHLFGTSGMILNSFEDEHLFKRWRM
ncbi:uncharacterized protein [Nicotiana tomentosiformis]|uniref:uncharacterized protein n=1 Tax=Nicotiana tomentosiformis TaxID=4098 RepID=UPI00388C77E6